MITSFEKADSENINKDGFFITLPNEEIITKTYVIDKTAAENIFKISGI